MTVKQTVMKKTSRWISATVHQRSVQELHVLVGWSMKDVKGREKNPLRWDHVAQADL